MNATDFTSEPIGYSPLANERTITLDDFNDRVARIVKRAQYLALITVEEAVQHRLDTLTSDKDSQDYMPLHRDDIHAIIRAVAATLGVPVPKGAQS